MQTLARLLTPETTVRKIENYSFYHYSQRIICKMHSAIPLTSAVNVYAREHINVTVQLGALVLPGSQSVS